MTIWEAGISLAKKIKEEKQAQEGTHGAVLSWLNPGRLDQDENQDKTIYGLALARPYLIDKDV